MTDTDTPNRPPLLPPEKEWTAAIGRLILDVAEVRLADGDRERIADALRRWNDWLAEQGTTHDGAYGALMVSLAKVAALTPTGCDHSPTGCPDCIATGLVMEDGRTGLRIDDPDQEFDTDEGRGVLLAMRMVVAQGNDDGAGTWDLFFACTDPEVTWCALWVLLELAGDAFLDAGERAGSLPPDVAAEWIARKEAMAANAPKGPPPSRERAGMQITELEVDPRDQGPGVREVTAPHGDAVYMVGPYPATAGAREHQAAFLIGAIRAQVTHDDPDVVLCGVTDGHFEDVEPHQLPHTIRPTFQRHMRQLARQTGFPVALVRAWQHRGGDCATAEAVGR